MAIKEPAIDEPTLEQRRQQALTDPCDHPGYTCAEFWNMYWWAQQGHWPGRGRMIPLCRELRVSR